MFGKKIFLSCFFLLDLIQLLSLDESDSLNYESDDYGSDFGSAGMCFFTFCFDESVGHVRYCVGCVEKYVGRVSDMGSRVFVPTGIDSIGDVVCWLCLYQKESSPKVVDS